jgi:uncharacterized membrane protein
MEKPAFAVEIVPHRSLSRRGFALIIGAVALFNLAGGVVMWELGAWPVIGFMGLDVALIWLALHMSFRSAGRRERIVITDEALHLDRYVGRRLTERLRLDRPFVYVDLEWDRARDIVGRLALRSRGRLHTVGAFLGSEERRALAGTLRNRLAGPRI